MKNWGGAVSIAKGRRCLAKIINYPYEFGLIKPGPGDDKKKKKKQPPPQKKALAARGKKWKRVMMTGERRRREKATSLK